MSTEDVYSAALCYSSYWNVGIFDRIININNVYAGVKGQHVTFRGSTTLQDWLRDIESVRLSNTPYGNIGDGFYTGMWEAFNNIIPLIDLNKTIYVEGHSLGASHADIFCTMLIKNYPKCKVVLVKFGSPNTGDKAFADWLDSNVTIRNYLNGEDIINDLPKAILGQDFSMAGTVIRINCQPIELDAWLFAKYHHMQLYCAALLVYVTEENNG